MKKSIVVLLLVVIATLVITSFKSEVKALDFASDYFTAEDVEITPNKTIPSNLGFSDYRYGILLSSSKDNASVKLNDTFVGKFSIDLMAYSSVSYASNQYETASYSNTYQDLNTFAIKFKNVKDSKEFKLVLNGGAKGNNVTVNAHVELNNEKMGLYYSKANKLVGNTKGANGADAYTFLWGTSFSNVAVANEAYSSKNVKPLKLEFDPIDMCLYGYSYGYSTNTLERMLIWDLKQASMDGSDSHSVLSSFEEYEVSLVYEDVSAGRTANVLVYGINGQSFSNTVIANNIGPTSSVLLKDGKVGEKYSLPLPKAYDVIEGAVDFSGSVSVLDPNGKEVSLYLNNNVMSNDSYASGCYFTPNMVGEYQVTYIAKDSKGVSGEALVRKVMINDITTVSFNHNLEDVLYYDLNSSFEIPAAKLLINGSSYDTKFTLYTPSKKEVKTQNIKLDEAGLYKLVYEANVSNNIYKDEISIYVSNKSDSLFNNNKCLSVESGNLYLNNEISGLVVKSKVDSSYITYKDALDIDYLNGNTCLVSMQANPSSWGSNSFSAITIKLIDAANNDNFIRVYCSTGNVDDISFVRAGAANQRLAGLTSDGTVSQTSSNGTAISHSFYGKANTLNLENQNFEVYFDYESKQIYTTNKVLVADLDDSEFYSTLWTGFESDKFYIEISISGIVDEASYLIDKVAGMDLSNSHYVDATSPVYSYNEADFISGLTNVYYPIPEISVSDPTSNTILKDVVVTLGNEEINVVDNKFMPIKLGRYVITYIFEDNFGNVTTLVKRVLIKENVEEIKLEVDNLELNGLVGDIITVPNYQLSGGSGVVNVTITALGINSKEKYVIEGFSFTPLVADTYKITYEAMDRLGNKNVNEVVLNCVVKLSDKPVIITPSYIPKVLVDGITTKFAETKAYDYNNASNPEVEVKLYLVVGGKEVEVNNYEHAVSLSKMNETVILKYVATSTVTKKTAELMYEIPAVKLYDEYGNLNVSQYLITNGFDSIDLTDGSIDLTTNKSNSTIEFIKNVYSDGFQISFNVPAAANNIDKVTIYLTDSVDPTKFIKLDVVKANLSDSFSYLIINDEVKVTMVGTFYSTTANRLKVVFDASLNAIKDDSGLVVSYLKTFYNGETFTGFSPEINFKIELGNVTGPTIFNLYEIGNQLMSNIDGDYTVPAVVYEEELVRISEIGSTVKIPSAKAIDILGFESSLTIRVLSPDKKVLYTSSEGKGTTINIDQYGTYYVYYIGSDDNTNDLTLLKIITVLDDVAPTITLNSGINSSAKLNDKITLPNATYSDNLTSFEKISSLIYVIDPNNVMSVVKDNQVKFEVKGKYTIRYFAIDEAGNVSFIDSYVEVK